MRIFRGIIAAIAVMTWLPCLGGNYVKPDPSKFLVSSKSVKISPADRETLASYVAYHLKTLPSDRLLIVAPKPLAVILFLVPENRGAVALDIQLGKGVVPNRIQGGQSGSFLAKVMTKHGKELLKSSDKSQRLFGAYMMDAALSLDPANESATYELAMYAKKNGDLDWTKILPGIGKQGNVAIKRVGPKRHMITKGLVPGYKSRSKNFVKQQASIKSMMVRVDPNNGYIGMPIDIIATVYQDGSSRTFGYQFQRGDIGVTMRKACQEAYQLQRGRYPFWTGGTRVGISFGDKYSPKDGGSAGTAFAMLFVSLLDGIAIDQKTGVTGDITVDWKVRAVGGVVAKIHGALDADLPRVAIPVDNAGDVYDFVLLEGPELLWRIQVFSLSTFDEAVETIRADRSLARQESEKLYSSIQSYLKEKGVAGINKKIYGALKKVVGQSPNHLSAKILIEYRQGKLKNRKLSITNSVYAIVGSGQFVLPIATSNRYKLVTKVDAAQLKEASDLLKKMKPVVPDEVKSLHSSYYSFVRALKDYKHYLIAIRRTPAVSRAWRRPTCPRERSGSEPPWINCHGTTN